MNLEKIMGASEQGKSGCEELIAIDNILNATDYGPDKGYFRYIYSKRARILYWTSFLKLN